MAGVASCTTFDSLPTELQVNVFAFIRTRADQTSASLVSRQWRARIAPLLWQRLASDFLLKPGQSLTALLHPDSGILPHVTQIHVSGNTTRNRHGSEEDDCDPMAERVLHCVLSALPRDALRRFSSKRVMSTAIIMHLLQVQSQLRYFSTRISSPNSAEVNESTSISRAQWLAPALGNIKKLGVYIDPSIAESYADNQFLVTNTGKLKSLTICGLRYMPALETASRTVLGKVDTRSPLQIETLKLAGLKLSKLAVKNQPVTLFQQVDFSTLTTLQIYYCNHVSRFLVALAACFSQRRSNLAKLDIRIRKHTNINHDVSMRAVQGFLLSLPPLRDLALDIGGSQLVDVSYVLRNGPYLQTLWLAAAEASKTAYLSAHDIKLLFESCPNVEQLAIDLRPIYLGAVDRAGSDFALNSKTIYPTTELETALDALAHAPKLHTMRINTLPIIEYPDVLLPTARNDRSIPDKLDILTQVAMQRFAGRIIRRLAEHGSKLKLLALVPTLLPSGTAGFMNKTGHYWPHYNYVRARTTDARGLEQVTALPLTNVSKEMPESSIIYI